MHRFYVENQDRLDGSITIYGEDVNHIRNVLRLSVGDEIVVGDGNEKDYICRICELTEDYVTAEIVDVVGNFAELPAKIVLYQGVPKADKLELIVQKAVELGAAEIVPVMMERTIVKLEEKKKEKKRERYQSIAESAAKQSRRGVIPTVRSFMSYKEAVKEAAAFDHILVPYESAEGMGYARNVIRGIVEDIKSRQINQKSESANQSGEKAVDETVGANETNNEKLTIGIFIGPEGGFADSEIERIKEEKNTKIISLGHRILRTETAGMAILSVLGFMMDDIEAGTN